MTLKICINQQLPLVVISGINWVRRKGIKTAAFAKYSNFIFNWDMQKDNLRILYQEDISIYRDKDSKSLKFMKGGSDFARNLTKLISISSFFLYIITLT